MSPQFDISWESFFARETSKQYWLDLYTFLESEQANGKIIYPPDYQWFRAFDETPLPAIKTVILGQDPYHGQGEAHGLCFSVSEGKRIPPSLRNIFKELRADVGVEIPASGDLSNWVKQGVFLLNTILTVEHKSPASHKNKGWEEFSANAIQYISETQPRVVFILWGKFAQAKASLIDEEKHLILKAPHPAAEVYAGGKAGFFGSKPFSKANGFLTNKIDWNL